MKPYPLVDDLLRPLHWLMTETAKTFQWLRGERGHFRERRYRACLVDDPATYPWWRCAAYALGTPSRLIWGCPGPPLGQAARRGERRVPDPLSPPKRETKKCSRASANSSTWSLRGVRYLFCLS
jgi:hypothetical protein